MKKLLLLTAIALSSVFIAVPHTPAQTAQFTFTPLTSLTVNPGDTLQFSIFLNYVAGGNIPQIGGLTYFLQQTSPTSPLSLSITRRDHGPGDNPGGPGDSLFDDTITSNSVFNTTHDPLNNSDGTNSHDLGALVDQGLYPPPAGAPSGNYFIANITLTILAGATPGQYTVQSTTASASGKASIINDGSGQFTFPISPSSITFTVIPEPSSYALLALGGIGLGVLAYRRRALA